MILGVFSSSYLFVTAFNFYEDILLYYQDYNYKTMLLDLLMGIFSDFIPIMVMIIFHYRNFRVKNQIDDTEQETVSKVF